MGKPKVSKHIKDAGKQNKSVSKHNQEVGKYKLSAGKHLQSVKKCPGSLAG